MTYIDSQPRLVLERANGCFVAYDPGHSWADFTAGRLRWHYGERAESIIAGNDPATQADLAAWNHLGRKDAA
jgi:hypothetical protein